MRLTEALEPNNLRLVFQAFDGARDLARDLRDDLSFVRTAIRGLGPERHRDHPPVPARVFDRPRPLDLSSLRGKRIGVVASGGSGATACLVGVQRAFEEAGVEPVVISACSGSMLFASLWASGLTSDEIASFWLGINTEDYVDPSWRSLAAAPVRALRGFAGLLKGDAVEATFDERLRGLRLGATKIPLHVVAWNIDRNRVEDFSSATMPELPVARATRVAISIPVFVEPVRIGDAYYGDGGIVDIFPTQPAIDADVDLVIATNTYLPTGFAGEDIGAWKELRWSILRASGQLRYSVYMELARQHARVLGDRLVLLEPVPYAEVRGARFYEQFLDRRDWPRFMRLGHEAARVALARVTLPAAKRTAQRRP
jgi:NTE family protein